jgi:hypothetical protein
MGPRVLINGIWYKRRPRGFSRYRRSERLIKGAMDAGLPVRGLEIDPVTGKLQLLFGKPDELHQDTPERVLKSL